jgi:hypothetical protein
MQPAVSAFSPQPSALVPPTDAWLLDQARKFLVEHGPPPHPLLRLPTAEEIASAMRKPLQYGLHHVSHAFAMHRQAVADADERTGEPLTRGFVLDPWYTLLEQYQHARTVYCGGGKRASKTECAAWLFVKSCLAYPGGRRWILGETENSSQNIQQPAIWKYLPRAWRTQLNHKESREFKLKYAEGRGFSDNLLVMPTDPPTIIKFLSFIQDPQHYQGWRLGAENFKPVTLRAGDREIPLPNMGWWADENMPLLWLETAETRSQDVQSCGLWTFSPLEGITATIKEMLGSPQVLDQKAAELLPPDRVMVPGCKPGQMPTVMECSRPRTRAVFFFRQDNPFGRYEDHAAEIRLKPETVIMRDSYGWAVDVRHRAFPKFGAVHIIKPEHLPSDGTNYMLTDPAGARRWATIWVRVDPRGYHFIYRDWPDKGHFGDWAVPSDREEEPDGRPGPAQQSDGMGVTGYKELFLNEETLTLEISGVGEWVETDPYRRRIADQLMVSARKSRPAPGRWNPVDVREVRGELAAPLREEILSRRVDPRAAGSEHAQEQGAKTVVDLFAERVVGPSGEVTEPMMLEPAYSGRQMGTGENAQIGTGLAEVNELLDWDPLDPNGMVPSLNEPRLFVSSRCDQVIWMMQTYTARGGAKGGCKDFADLVRYMALADLQYIGAEGMLATGGGTY